MGLNASARVVASPFASAATSWRTFWFPCSLLFCSDICRPRRGRGKPRPYAYYMPHSGHRHEDYCCDDHVGDRQGEQELPSQAHQHVVAEPRKGRPQPDVHEQERHHLDEEPEEGWQQRSLPAREKDQGGERRDGDHVD